MAPKREWIAGRGYDLAFFFLPSALAAAAGAACLWRPGLVAPLWWLWVWLIEGPHLFATYSRLFLDERELREKRRLVALTPVVIGGVLLVWAAWAATGSPVPFEALLAAAAAASYYHGARQHYGIMSLYHRYAASGPRERAVDYWYLHVTLAALFAIPLFTLAANRRVLGMTDALPPGLSWGASAAQTALLLYTLWYAAEILRRRREGLSIKPPLFALGPVGGLAVVSVFWIGPREPLYAAPMNNEQLFLVVTLMGGIFHGVEYLGIALLLDRRRHERAEGPGLWARVARRPALAYAAFVALSLGYVALNAARGQAPGLSLFEPEGGPAKFFLAFYWAVFFHHYWIDQNIWRVQSDARLREELLLA
ncbi:MAG: hypothetical protein HY553_17705 [Elusimicrobia bacterium]|nr:hypothetical protein [Elusimicrobiota bacterium]